MVSAKMSKWPTCKHFIKVSDELGTILALLFKFYQNDIL